MIATDIMAELNPRAMDKGIAKLREERTKCRGAEEFAAFDFLMTGATAGPSPDGEAWSRDYDTLPYPEALPADLKMYAGTGVGTLYGLPGSEVHAWQLAGWNLVPRGKEMV